jgi:diguanylate cyclase (GGDEF)-like protein/PAS domain S-box-containing protein
MPAARTLTDAARETQLVLVRWAKDPGGKLTIALGMMLAAFLLWLPFKWGGEGNVALIDNLAFLPFGAAAAALCYRASTHSALDEATRRAWRILAAAFCAYFLGDLLWLYYENIAETAPFPSFADLGYLAFYPLALWGLISFPCQPRSRGENLKLWLDLATVLLGGGMVIWYLVLRPTANSDDTFLLTSLSLAYPVGDLVLLFGIAAVMLRRPEESSRHALAIVGSGFLLWVIADVIFGYLSLNDAYSTGHWVDGLWLTAIFLMGVAAQYQYAWANREAHQTAVDPAAPPERGFSPLPLVAVVVSLVVLLMASDDVWNKPLGGLILCAIVLTAFVVIRQLVSLQENTRLLRQTTSLASDLQRSEARFRSLVQNASDVILVTDESAIITYESPSVQRVLGYEPYARIGTDAFAMVHPDDLVNAREVLADIMAHPGESRTTEFRGRHADGTWRWIEITARNLLHDPSVNGLVGNYRDITERKALEDKLIHQAFHDVLTGLANRALFRNRVEHAMARSSRHNIPLAVLFMDLDDFKTINDSLGHAAGDSLLMSIAERLAACLRTSDTAARLGGDEFAVLLEGTTPGEAASAADRILRALRAPIEVSEKQVYISASIGIAGYRAEHATQDDLLRDADAAMYRAKADGKGRYDIFDPNMHTAAVERLELKADLQRALDNGEFVLYYQPIIDLETGAFTAVEALLRWKHPERGLVLPGEFIPLAEETGLIVPLGRWVLNVACRQVADWQARYPGRAPAAVSVNLSPKQLREHSLVSEIRQAVRDSGLRPERLLLEITEGAIMQDTDAALLLLNDIHNLGVRLAIDDFGTGYSSLKYLQMFPVDVLKIDRFFVTNVGEAAADTAVARAIVDLGHTLGLRIIAEGVEHPRQSSHLRVMGCDMAQGFAICRPIPPDDFERALASDTAAAAAS